MCWSLECECAVLILAHQWLNAVLATVAQHFGILLKKGISKKNTEMHAAMCRNYTAPVQVMDLVEALKDVASLLVCTQKKFFCLGVEIFCEWRHKWRTFSPPWPTLPRPRRQLLDGSISLKFLLETKLQSEFFDRLDDLLGFRVQKLWSKPAMSNPNGLLNQILSHSLNQGRTLNDLLDLSKLI